MNVIDALKEAAGPLERKGEGVYERSYFFPPDFLGFQGHFPGRPVLPAFIQLLMARLLYGDAAGEPVESLDVKSAKFMEAITPGQRVTARLEGGRAAIICGGREAAVIRLGS